MARLHGSTKLVYDTFVEVLKKHDQKFINCWRDVNRDGKWGNEETEKLLNDLIAAYFELKRVKEEL